MFTEKFTSRAPKCSFSRSCERQRKRRERTRHVGSKERIEPALHITEFNLCIKILVIYSRIGINSEHFVFWLGLVAMPTTNACMQKHCIDKIDVCRAMCVCVYNYASICASEALFSRGKKKQSKANTFQKLN